MEHISDSVGRGNISYTKGSGCSPALKGAQASLHHRNRNCPVNAMRRGAHTEKLKSAPRQAWKSEEDVDGSAIEKPRVLRSSFGKDGKSQPCLFLFSSTKVFFLPKVCLTLRFCNGLKFWLTVLLTTHILTYRELSLIFFPSTPITLRKKLHVMQGQTLVRTKPMKNPQPKSQEMQKATENSLFYFQDQILQ